jgi:hypothetical protein
MKKLTLTAIAGVALVFGATACDPQDVTEYVEQIAPLSVDPTESDCTLNPDACPPSTDPVEPSGPDCTTDVTSCPAPPVTVPGPTLPDRTVDRTARP